MLRQVAFSFEILSRERQQKAAIWLRKWKNKKDDHLMV